jgi:hypothetical protein
LLHGDDGHDGCIHALSTQGLYLPGEGHGFKPEAQEQVIEAVKKLL